MRSVALVFALVGCHHDVPDIVLPPDAAIDASPPPNSVTIQVFDETPVFIAYRDGTGPWQMVDQASGVYTMHIHDSYELVAVCGDSSVGFDTGFEAATFADVHGRTYVPCFSSSGPDTTTVTVTGTMAQAGWVAIGDGTDQGMASNWHFSVDVAPGTYDLMAIAGNRMTVRRDLAVAGAMSVANVDVASAGSPMTAIPLAVTGTQSDETVRTEVLAITANEFLSLPPETTGTSVHVIPPALAVSTDHQYVEYNATTATSFRNVLSPYAQEPSLAFTLLPRLANIQFGALGASWSTIPSGNAELFMYGGSSAIHMTATAAWLGSATQLAIDTNIPGFQPAWVPATIDSKQFDVQTNDSRVYATTGVSEGASVVAKKVARLRRSIRLN